MIFSKKSDAALASLVKQLDEAIEEHKDDKLKAFVNLLGDDRDKLEAEAAKLVADQKIKNIPVVVPVENESGPANYGLNPEATLTVLFYRGMEVKSNRALGEKEFTKGQVSKLLEDVSKIVK
jgi:arsenate reductase-like glutaredoxin family protein